MAKNLVVSTELQAVVLDKLMPFKEQVSKWKAEAESIVVTDASQVELIQKSALARKTLTTIRTSIEKARKELKAGSLDYGRFIDSIASDITAEVTPLEEHYRANEEFIERAELKLQQELKAKRMEIIREKGISEYEITINLGTADDKQFNDFIAFKDFEAKKKLEEEEAESKKKKEEEKKLLLEKRWIARLSQLIKYGFMADELQVEFKNKDIEVIFGEYEIRNDSDEDWNSKIADITAEIRIAKEEQDKEKIKIAEIMGKRRLAYNQLYTPTSKPLPEGFELLTDSEWKLFFLDHLNIHEEYQEEAKKKADEALKAKAEEKKQQEEKEAAERLNSGSDKDKMAELFAVLSPFKFPTMKSNRGKLTMVAIESNYEAILDLIEKFIDNK